MIQVFNVLKKYKLNGYNYSENPRDFTYKKSILSDKDIVEFLKNVGAKQSTSVSKSTFLVVAKNKDEDTGKAEEARKLNVPIISVEEFMQTYLSK